MFWTPYADWIYVIVSISGMLLIIVLVLRPGAGPPP
ncbi:adenylosuccinate lyase [Synechococcus sp. BIOS-U3-1]|nr:adenylosuccinate lyase [Synechococcus sp. BIOS-U3-1]